MKKHLLLIPSLVALTATPFISLTSCFESEEDDPTPPGPTPPEPEPIGTCFTITALETSTVFLNCDPYELGINPPNVSYSLDDTNEWINYDVPDEAGENGDPITVEKGHSLLLKGNNPNGFNNEDGIWRIMTTGSVAFSGNIMSLLDDGRLLLTSIPSDYCFQNLFYIYDGEEDYGSIVDAKDLIMPAIDLTKSCYEGMFVGQIKLKIPPLKLPAMKLMQNCYDCMFGFCYSLIETPYLPATSLVNSCYSCMFQDCYSLKVREASEMNADVISAPIFSCPEHDYYDTNSMFSQISEQSEWKGADPKTGKTYYWYHDAE